MDLKELALHDNSMTLLIAPPAWGKTLMLISLLKTGRKIIFLSPLRALAEELYEKTKIRSH